MTTNFFTSAFMLVFLYCIAGLQSGKAQSKLEEEAKHLEAVLALDSLFWKAYNNCEVEAYEPFFTDDLEFYHDKGGITKSRDQLLKSSKEGMCGNEDWRLRRELVKGSMRLFPLHENGMLYGALLSGEHLFYVNEKGKEEHLDGIALFSHLWMLDDGTWKMSRVISYDHRPATYNPNVE